MMLNPLALPPIQKTAGCNHMAFILPQFLIFCKQLSQVTEPMFEALRPDDGLTDILRPLDCVVEAVVAPEDFAGNDEARRAEDVHSFRLVGRRQVGPPDRVP